MSTVEKAIDLLVLLHERGAPLGVSELARMAGLPKSSAHRMLAAMMGRELVEQDERGRYRPGIGLVELALGVLRRELLVAAGHVVIDRCAGELKETFFLVAVRAGRLLVVDRVEGSGVLRASPDVG